MAAGTHKDEPDSVTAVVTWAPTRGWIAGNTAQTQVYGPPARGQLPARPSALRAPGRLRQERGTLLYQEGIPQGGRVPPGRCGDTWAWVPGLRVLSQTTNPRVQLVEVTFPDGVLGALHCDFGQPVSALSLHQLAEGTFFRQ